jgi:hypothetical protein
MRTLVTGLGEVVSGDIGGPLLDADSILIEDGDRGGRRDRRRRRRRHRRQGRDGVSGLIDSTCPVFGDWTPRQRRPTSSSPSCTAA